MLVCSGCRSQQYNGTIYCPICGAGFAQDSDSSATSTPSHATAPAQRTPSSGTSSLATLGVRSPAQRSPSSGTSSLATDARALRATLHPTGRHIKLPLTSPILIGRADSARSFFPDLDLSKDGGIDGGVSRRHARITLRDAEAYVEDLDSSNGTFVNNQRVAPRTEQPLHAGDDLRLGSVSLHIEAI